jgi:hypothetical protein
MKKKNGRRTHSSLIAKKHVHRFPFRIFALTGTHPLAASAGLSTFLSFLSLSLSLHPLYSLCLCGMDWYAWQIKPTTPPFLYTSATRLLQSG